MTSIERLWMSSMDTEQESSTDTVKSGMIQISFLPSDQPRKIASAAELENSGALPCSWTVQQVIEWKMRRWSRRNPPLTFKMPSIAVRNRRYHSTT